MRLPEILTFHRKPISKTTPQITSPESKAAEQDSSPQGIYGSVSTTDIANRIKELLVTDAEARQLTLGPENITFIGLEDNKVKTLGHWDVEIHVGASKDVLKPVHKRIAVLAEEEDQQNPGAQ